MKPWIFYLLILLAGKAGDPSSGGPARAAAADLSLSVIVEGMENTKGEIRFGLYAEGSEFPEPDGATSGTIAGIEGERVQHTFRGLVPGHYAVGVIHDENRDGKLTRNLLGMPKEGYGFSNNAFEGNFRPPTFRQASIRLRQDTTIRIQLKYFLPVP